MGNKLINDDSYEINKFVFSGSGLSRLPLTTKLKWQVRDSSVPESYQSWMQPSSLGNQLQTWDCPPALFKKGEEGRKKKKKEVLHLSRCYTHTHTRQSRGNPRGNPERQEEEKSGHTTGRRPKTAQGGRGTDGPPEPTDTAKRTWQKQSTHLNPTTHYGEASRRVIRDQWGLVGEKRKQQNCQTGLSS